MKKLITGLTYAYKRNIGWQDRTIRTIAGIAATAGVYLLFETHFGYALILGIFAIAQFWTVLSAKCIICYFAGACTITNHEKKELESKGIQFEG